MRKTILTAMLALGIVLVSAGMATAGQLVKASAGDVFDPTPVHVSVRERVIWKNIDSEDHDVKSTSSNWHKAVTTISPGERTSFRFKNKGRYTYKCTIHPGMDGVIRVG